MNDNQDNPAPRVFFEDVIEVLEAEDGPAASANFSAGTTETCDARAR